jgi:hypothetical protein
MFVINFSPGVEIPYAPPARLRVLVWELSSQKKRVCGWPQILCQPGLQLPYQYYPLKTSSRALFNISATGSVVLYDTEVIPPPSAFYFPISWYCFLFSYSY